MPPLPAAIPDVVDLQLVRGADADAAAGPDLLIEIPHGATRTADYDRYARQLTSPLPADLVDFFHVNTDAGAPELAVAIAELVVAAAPRRQVAIVRCRVPRTFIDCNRQIDASPEDFRTGKVGPGLMPWITTAEDRALLRGAFDAYVATVAAAAAALAPDGAMLMLHTYAPRTVDVEVDLEIVPNLRRAWAADRVDTWPLRPALDVIGRTLDGVDHAPPAVVAALTAAAAELDLAVATGVTYPLHPSTQAHAHVLARPGRTLCVEVRRDLLAEPFTPFAEMRIGAAQVARLARPLATAIAAWW
ncbi:MAG: N-formylglutamate amidohydrolase [Myxococcales bacterium]|nr:N-formylglutamate amidohydrolase [Myxococcales bacterium]